MTSGTVLSLYSYGPNLELIVTGHSFGAALATLRYEKLGHSVTCVGYPSHALLVWILYLELVCGCAVACAPPPKPARSKQGEIVSGIIHNTKV